MNLSNRHVPLHHNVQPQQGFVLLAVLVVAVVLVSLVAVVSATIERRLATVSALKKQSSQTVYLSGVQAELVYLTATQGIAVNGLVDINQLEQVSQQFNMFRVYPNAMRTDGQYTKFKGVDVSLQNDSGLIPFNSADTLWLTAAMTALDINATQQAKMIDALVDYLDRDDWQEPFGNEAPSNKNFLLQNCLQLHELKAWKQNHLKILTPICGLSRSPSLNLNAVPLAMWALVWPQSAMQVKTARENGNWFVSDYDYLNIEPSLANIQSEFIGFVSGSRFRLITKQQKVQKFIDVEIGLGENQPYKYH